MKWNGLWDEKLQIAYKRIVIRLAEDVCGHWIWLSSYLCRYAWMNAIYWFGIRIDWTLSIVFIESQDMWNDDETKMQVNQIWKDLCHHDMRRFNETILCHKRNNSNLVLLNRNINWMEWFWCIYIKSSNTFASAEKLHGCLDWFIFSVLVWTGKKQHQSNRFEKLQLNEKPNINNNWNINM